MRQFFLGILLTASLSTGAVSQELRRMPGTSVAHRPRRAAIQAESPSWTGPVLGGLLGGTVGFVAGAYAGGSTAEGSCNNEDLSCLLGGILIGAAIGEAALLPVGAHLGAGRRGSLGKALLASVGIAAVGVGLTVATEQPALLIPFPILQLWAVTVLEKAGTQEP